MLLCIRQIFFLSQPLRPANPVDDSKNVRGLKRHEQTEALCFHSSSGSSDKLQNQPEVIAPECYRTSSDPTGWHAWGRLKST